MNGISTQSYFLNQPGDANKAFELKENVIDFPKYGEVLIEVEAFGINYADVMARHGNYRDAPKLPAVLGYEVVGIIRSAPENDDVVGKRVLAFTRFGGYAKDVVTKMNACVFVGNEKAEDLLALATQGVTAYYMMNVATNVFKGELALVHAASGGVGSILVQLLKAKGLKVVAKVGDNSKIQTALELGADHALNYKSDDYISQIKALLPDQKMDVVFNPVGGSTFRKDLGILNFGGRLILFGGAELSGRTGIFSQLNFLRKMGLIIPVFKMMKSQSIIGVNMLKIADYKADILNLCLEGIYAIYSKQELKIISGGKFAASQLPEAHKLLESGKSKGKISIFW